ncbi:unnamed protein product [Rotaria sordida]|uniref:PDZ domain-containing protein n=1 Tax=Rotaria sordida TaxID=392033 RepID=A0A818UZG7_9BILA|nr:unnamed protein product [Rotaria sordida]CAF1163391.1 unnamed protein product [Rotaria sordida]CAF3648869.1 unnamed protein product [Rotaria sordida]CAF3703834.1 unnamed protein product [Rotaria sordida]
MLTISSSSLTPIIRGPFFRHRHRSSSSDLYRPRTIIIEKPTINSSYGFSIQTYGFASLNSLSTDESACSLVSSSSESTTSRKSLSISNSFSSSSHIAPIQLVTYVDHVEDKSPAWEAGLRSGSVILSVNDQTVENDDHEKLVQRIAQTSLTQLKLIVIQQNITKQIELCEQLQQLHKQLHEKEEELKELCKQEMNSKDDISVKETDSPLPLLQHSTINSPERTSSFCHDKIPLDWRQSVTNFAHQKQLITQTLPTILNSSSSKYTKNRQVNSSQHHQRSMSLSTIVLHCSKSSLRRYHSPIINQQTTNRRRAFSYEELFSLNKNKTTNYISSNNEQDESMIISGCSLAMDLSRSFDRKNSQSSSSSASSSSTTINIDDIENDQKEKIDNKIKHFKWKLRINK